jgi:hypothetical protein
MDEFPKLRWACSSRGADHGRPAFLPSDRSMKVKLRLARLRLDQGGYDKGGAYWGGRKPGWHIYWAESLEEFELAPLARPNFGTVEMTVDAVSREDAKRRIRHLLPNAGFFR